MKGFSHFFTRFLSVCGTRDCGVTSQIHVVPEIAADVEVQVNELDSEVKTLDHPILKEKKSKNVSFVMRSSAPDERNLPAFETKVDSIYGSWFPDPDDEYNYLIFKPSVRPSKWILPGNFMMRDLDLEEYIGYGFKSSVSKDHAERMKRVLFATGFDPVIENGQFGKILFNVLTDSDIYGPKPPLPFTLDSFIEYLFENARDVQVIRILLHLCQKDPNILTSYDRKLQAQGLEYNVRDEMLLFLIKMRRCDEAVSGRRILQLMGFKTLTNLKIYYRNDGLMDEALLELESNCDDQSSGSKDDSIIYNFE